MVAPLCIYDTTQRFVWSDSSPRAVCCGRTVHRVQTLEVDKLVEEAIEAHNNNEMLEVVEETPPPDDAAPPQDDGLVSTEPTIIDDNRTDEGATIPGPSGRLRRRLFVAM